MDDECIKAKVYVCLKDNSLNKDIQDNMEDNANVSIYYF